MPSSTAMKKAVQIAAAIALAFAGAVPVARADDDTGFQIGDGRLHLQLDLGARYDSFAAINAQNQPSGDYLLDARPGLKLSLPSPVFAFDLSGDADAIYYVLNPGLSRILADGAIGVGINRAGVVGVEIADQFTRSDNNNMVALPFAVISDFNDAKATVPIRPGGGALVIEPGYDFLYEHFEPAGAVPTGSCTTGNPLCDPTLSSDMDFYEHKISLNLRWKFLPKTALLAGGDFYLVNYLTPGSGASANVPMDLADGWLGVGGLFTSRLEIVAKAGYAQTILGSNASQIVPALATVGDNRTFIGQFQLAWLFSETGNLKLGVVRLLNPAPTVLADYADTRPYLSFRWLLGGRVTLHLDGAYDIFNYQLDSQGNAAGRQDGYLHADVGAEVEILRWLRVAAGYDISDLSSTDKAVFIYNSSSLFGGTGYTNHEVYLRLTFAY